MPLASTSAFGVGASMPVLSQIVTAVARPDFHNLCDASDFTECDIARMDSDKNGGPNYLKAWREFRRLTQDQLAEKVGTNANMISYLESGERGLSAKWLRRLAPVLETTAGMLLDHDPNTLDSDIIDIWTHAGTRERQQISDIAKAVLKTGTSG